MSLVEKLMKLDRGKLEEIPQARMKALRLSQVMGEDVYITVQAVPGDKFTELLSLAQNKKTGIADASKARRSQALVCVAGVVEPSLKDHDLMEHFGAATPEDLAKKLFPGGELVDVFNKIGDLSGFSEREDVDIDDEIKN